MHSVFTNKKYQLIIIVVATFLAFSNIFQNDFVLDDTSFIKTWQESQEGNIRALIAGNVPEGHLGVYRPIRSLLYTFYYNLFGDYTFWYHLHSILVHLGITVLAYLIVEKLTKRKIIAFASALLFGTHPIHTEAITYMSASMEITGVLFMFASFYLYILWKENKKNSVFLYSSVILAFLAVFTYEMTLTLPILILLYEYIFNKKHLRNLFGYLAIYFLPVIAYVVIRFGFLNMPPRGEYMGGSFWLTILTMAKAFLKYIELLFLPVNLSINHTLYGGIDTIATIEAKKEILLAQSILDLPIFFGILTFGFLIFLVFKFWKSYPIVSFALGWFLVSLIPVSNIVPIQQVMSEKYLYIPSFGFVLIIGVLLFFLNQQRRHLFLIILAILAVYYGYTTFERNKDWRSDISIWEKAVEVTPNSPSVHYNLGYAYYKKGQIEKAVQEYKRALEINPDYAAAHNNLASIYFDAGLLEQAEYEYYKTLESGGAFWTVYFSLGNLYVAQGRVSDAIKAYRKTLELNPNFQPARQAINLLLKKTSSDKID